MKNPFNPLLSLLLGLPLLSTSPLQAQQSSAPVDSSPASLATTTPIPGNWGGEEDEEMEWLLDSLFLTAETIGMEEDDLFSALAHGLSMADVALAHGVNPLDILDIALSLEESEILEELIEEEIDLSNAEEWRDSLTADSAWLLYENDPFGLEDIAWVLDGTADACDLSMMELAGWIYDGVSIEDIAMEMEVELDEVIEFSVEYLEDSIEISLLLEEVNDEEAEEWLNWSKESLEDILTDEDLFETLAYEIWTDEMVAILADLMQLEEEELWNRIEEGEELQGLFESHKVEIDDEELEAEIHDFLSWWDEDDFEDGDDHADF